MPARVDVVVIGAGQAGLSLSRCLSEVGIDHLVLERGRVGESWRSQRWDSFRLVTPNWTVRLAGEDYSGPDPGGFMTGAELIERLETYAADLPVCESVEVTAVHPEEGGWRVETHRDEAIHARAVVVATATHARPKIPAVAVPNDRALSLHASDYRRESTLPAGGVLVVGSGQSGAQIACELHRAGRHVVLATSEVGRLPRRYRGRDVIDWQADMGLLDRHVSALSTPEDRFRPDPQMSGQNGGETLNLLEFARQGIELAGRLDGMAGEHVRFDDDLLRNLSFADRFDADFRERVDAFIQTQGIEAPFEETFPASRATVTPVTELSLGPDGISTIIWATGFRPDFHWIHGPVLFDSGGYPVQSAWRSSAAGLHFLGFNYVEHRRSGILYGAGIEARALACAIANDIGSRNTPG